MGIDISPEAGWLHNQGLRIIGGGMRLELPWPDLASFPDYGLVRTRADFDEILARQAPKAGARLMREHHGHRPGPRRAHRPHRRRHRQDRRRRAHLPRPARHRGRRQLHPAVARDGPGQARRPPDGRRRPHLLHEPAARRRLARVVARAVGRPATACCPATAGSSASATAPPTSASASSTPPRPSATSTTRTCCAAGWRPPPQEWGFHEDNRTSPIRGAALPMGFNRTPHYTRGLLLVGDAGGMVNPFNGEGIAYAMESGRDRRRDRRAGPRPARGRGTRARAAGLPRRAQADATAATTRSVAAS